MSTLFDGRIGMKKETTFGTAVVVDRFYENLADSPHSWDPMVIQGEGLHNGIGYPILDRRVAGTGKGDFTIKVELKSKGLGVLLEAIAPNAASTTVSGSMYQEMATSTVTGTTLNAYTVQFGIPDMTGTIQPYTYAGCVPKSFEIDAPSGGVPTLSVNFWASTVVTGTSLASVSYPSSPTIFADSTGKAGATLGGSITVPTTTALESGGTAASNIRSWNLSVDLGINERPKLGGWQKPTVGRGAATLKVDQDFDALTMSALLLSQGATSFTGYYTGAQVSSLDERFGVVVPAMKLDADAFGQLTTGEGSVPSLSFTCGSNLTDAVWYLVARTADTSL